MPPLISHLRKLLSRSCFTGVQRVKINGVWFYFRISTCFTNAPSNTCSYYRHIDLQPYLLSLCLCPSVGVNAVRDPVRRRRARIPGGPFFTSSGALGVLGKDLNGPSASQRTGNFGFWYHTNTLVEHALFEPPHTE